MVPVNFIECVYKKHCNTTVYLVLDQAANILLKLLKGGTDLFSSS